MKTNKLYLKKKREAINFLRKVRAEVNNYHKFGTELSDDVKQFALKLNNWNNTFYFCSDEASEMLSYYINSEKGEQND